MSAFGIASIFVVTAAVHLGFAAYTLYRIVNTPALTEEQRVDFVAVPVAQVQPLPTELDPRAGDDPPAGESAAQDADGEPLDTTA